jgi:hypothetical protein
VIICLKKKKQVITQPKVKVCKTINSTMSPVVYVTVTGTTTVTGLIGSSALLSSTPTTFASPTTTDIPSEPTRNEIPPLPSGWPTPLPKEESVELSSHNNTVAILTLVFLILLCFIFVLFGAYFVFQKWKGDSSKCRSLQDIIDKYARGDLVPITKQTCADREKWLKEQANFGKEKGKGKKEENKNASTWSSNFRAGPEYEHSVRSAKADNAGINQKVQLDRDRSLEALEGNGPDTLERERAYMRNGAAFAEKYDLEDMKERGLSFNEPHKSRGMHNPYAMRGIPTGKAGSSRTFATYGEHLRDARRNGVPALSEQSLSDSMEQIPTDELTHQYRDACREAGRGSNPFRGESIKLASYLYEQIKERHRSGAYGRMTPPPSPPGAFTNVDLEGQTERSDSYWKIWLSKNKS